MRKGGSSGRWRERQRRDPYVKRRKEAGLRSRAAFKLEQLCTDEKLLQPGARVIDLGAAPGGWAQLAATRAGRHGTVIAVDILKIQEIPGATLIQGDCCSERVFNEVEAALDGHRADLVMSDMAPNITGVAVRDEAAHEELVEMTLRYVDQFLKPGGALLTKLFQYGDTERLIESIRERFAEVSRRKPDASRSGSREFYVVAKRFGI